MGVRFLCLLLLLVGCVTPATTVPRKTSCELLRARCEKGTIKKDPWICGYVEYMEQSDAQQSCRDYMEDR